MSILLRIFLAPISIAFIFMAWIIRRVREERAERLSRLLVGFALASQRGRRLRNMRRVFSDWDEDQIRRLNKAHMRYISRLIVEIVRLRDLTDEQIRERISLEGEAHLREALNAGKGILLLGSHVGNWWYVRAALSSKGYRISTVANRIPVRSVESYLNNFRKRFKIRNTYVGEGGSTGAAGSFDRNEIFALLFDISVPGREAQSIGLPIGDAVIKIDLGPASLAVRHKPAVLYASVQAVADHRARVTITPVSFAADPRGTQINPEQLTRFWLDGLYQELRQSPEQWWHWSHLILEDAARTRMPAEKPR